MVGANDFKFNLGCYGLPGSGIRGVEISLRRDGLSCAGMGRANEFNFRARGYDLSSSGIRSIEFSFRRDGLSCACVAGARDV
jgi:hypothetical protein